MLKVAFSPIYKYELPDGHRFPMIKYELLPEQLLREGTLNVRNFFQPDQLSDDSILLTHSKTYLDRLCNLPLPRKEERAIGFPVRPELVQRGRHIAQGTFDCAVHALSYGIAMNIAGGTHHAFQNHGEGFCVFNDVAIASNMMLGRGDINKILIVDLDVHQGNGTASIFKNINNVYTFSMHGAKNYPLRKEQSDIDIGLADGIDDTTYLKFLNDHLPGVIDQFQPDLIFYLSGVDILATDKLGRLNVSRQGCKKRDQFVLELCKRNNIPVVITMSGGYSHRIADIVEAHANTFRVAQEMYF